MKVHLGRYLKDKPRKIQVKIDNWDTWDAYVSLSYIILPLLKEFRKTLNGHPGTLTMEEWESIVDKMIFAFENILDDEVETFNIEVLNEVMPKRQEGLELFGKYFEALWN